MAVGRVERKPTGQPRSEAVGRWGLGQWAGNVRIKRRQGRFRPDLPGSPITGAGLDPWVCDPSCAPDGITSNGSDGEGCWGEETAGANAVVGVDIGRVVAVPVGGAAFVGFVEPGTAAQQLDDPPSELTVQARLGPGRRKIRREQTGDGAAERCGHGLSGRSSSTPRHGPFAC